MDIANAASLIEQSVAQNNAWSAQQAQNQMDFQREMSNTAFQRQVADLKAAGLNPVLAARLGGASTPSGAMGDTDTSGTSALVQLLEMAMETANSAAGAAHAAIGSGSGSAGSASEESLAYRLLGTIGSASGEEWRKKVFAQEQAVSDLADKLEVNRPRGVVDYTKNALAEILRFAVGVARDSRESGTVPPAGTSARKAYNRFNDIKEPETKSNFQKWQDANRSAILANMYRLRSDAGRKGNGGR